MLIFFFFFGGGRGGEREGGREKEERSLGTIWGVDVCYARLLTQLDAGKE